jgi:ABC-2 type transport system permease protein
MVFTKISWIPLFIAFFGIYLLAATYAAMNLFCSSLTQSAIVAYVMAVMFNVAIWFLGAGVETFDNSTVRAVFEHISLNQHLVGMAEGTIRTNSLIYFASVIFLFTFLCERVVETSRWRS